MHYANVQWVQYASPTFYRPTMPPRRGVLGTRAAHRGSNYFENECTKSWLFGTAKLLLPLAATLLLHGCAAVPSVSASPRILQGPARVIDGDTIVVDNTRVRLFGIDAPESKQSCGFKGHDVSCGTSSTNALIKKIGKSPVRCLVKRKDIYGRSVAICKLDGRMGEQDLNGWMVAQGHAVRLKVLFFFLVAVTCDAFLCLCTKCIAQVAYRRYSRTYVKEEDRARAEKKGIWATDFEQPDVWRKEHPRGRTK